MMVKYESQGEIKIKFLISYKFSSERENFHVNEIIFLINF